MAIHLQDSFENKPTDTPMTTKAKGIEQNLMQLYATNVNFHSETTSVYLIQKEAEKPVAESGRLSRIFDQEINKNAGQSTQKTYYLM